MKRYPKNILINLYKNKVEPLPMQTEPHEIIYSPQENLRQILQNYKALSKSIDAFTKSWAENENIRNRPERQKLCNELCEIVPNGIKFSNVIHKIEKSTGFDVYF
jgi:hypothetical protein